MKRTNEEKIKHLHEAQRLEDEGRALDKQAEEQRRKHRKIEYSIEDKKNQIECETVPSMGESYNLLEIPDINYKSIKSQNKAFSKTNVLITLGLYLLVLLFISYIIISNAGSFDTFVLAFILISVIYWIPTIIYVNVRKNNKVSELVKEAERKRNRILEKNNAREEANNKLKKEYYAKQQEYDEIIKGYRQEIEDLEKQLEASQKEVDKMSNMIAEGYNKRQKFYSENIIPERFRNYDSVNYLCFLIDYELVQTYEEALLMCTNHEYVNNIIGKLSQLCSYSCTQSSELVNLVYLQKSAISTEKDKVAAIDKQTRLNEIMLEESRTQHEEMIRAQREMIEQSERAQRETERAQSKLLEENKKSRESLEKLSDPYYN